jgi:hypothetical protein
VLTTPKDEEIRAQRSKTYIDKLSDANIPACIRTMSALVNGIDINIGLHVGEKNSLMIFEYGDANKDGIVVD